MVCGISIVILVHMPIARVGCGVNGAFALLEARWWCLACVCVWFSCQPTSTYKIYSVPLNSREEGGEGVKRSQKIERKEEGEDFM